MKTLHWIFLLCEDVRYRKGSLYDPLNFMFILVLGIKNSKNQSQMWHHDFEECVRVPTVYHPDAAINALLVNACNQTIYMADIKEIELLS